MKIDLSLDFARDLYVVQSEVRGDTLTAVSARDRGEAGLGSALLLLQEGANAREALYQKEKLARYAAAYGETERLEEIRREWYSTHAKGGLIQLEFLGGTAHGQKRTFSIPLMPKCEVPEYNLGALSVQTYHRVVSLDSGRTAYATEKWLEQTWRGKWWRVM